MPVSAGRSAAEEMQWTIPNTLTVSRLVAAPLVAVVFIVFSRPLADWIALAVFLTAAATDFLDGYLARLWKQESGFGRMLDPIADKAMVIIALAVLMALFDMEPLIALPAVVIMFRETFVSGLREFMGDKSDVLGVVALARWKTTFQMVAVAGLFLATGMKHREDDAFVAAATSVAETGGGILLWLAAAITVVTGWAYFRQALPFAMGGPE